MESRLEEINNLPIKLSFRNRALRSNTQGYEELENYLKDDDELSLGANMQFQIELQDELKGLHERGYLGLTGNSQTFIDK